MALRVNFGFIPFPLSIVDEGIALSLGEYRLLGYLLRHRFRVKTEAMLVTQDEMLHGVFAPNGVRRDRGCGITSPRDLKAARLRLEGLGWLKVDVTPGGLVYELSLASDAEGRAAVDESVDADRSTRRRCDSAKCTSAEPSAFCTCSDSAICSFCQCNLSDLPVQNALPLKEEKVKKVKEEVLALTAVAVQVRPLRRSSPDDRHDSCKRACEAYAAHKGVEFIWDGSEAKALALLLKACPGMTVDRFIECVRNRARSPVSHGERPRVWLPAIAKYQSGPLDRFGIPEGENDGSSGRHTSGSIANASGGATKRTNGNLSAAQRVYESVVGGVAGTR